VWSSSLTWASRTPLIPELCSWAKSAEAGGRLTYFYRRMVSSGMLRRVALVRTDVTSQKTPFFIVTAVKTSSRPYFYWFVASLTVWPRRCKQHIPAKWSYKQEDCLLFMSNYICFNCSKTIVVLSKAVVGHMMNIHAWVQEWQFLQSPTKSTWKLKMLPARGHSYSPHFSFWS
jgi:hypothetical protein